MVKRLVSDHLYETYDDGRCYQIEAWFVIDTTPFFKKSKECCAFVRERTYFYA